MTISDQLRETAKTADKLHERSRTLLVNAVRSGVAGGLSQREIAAAIGRSQPEVSRLLRFHGKSDLGRTLANSRAQVLAETAKYGAKNVRVFGSVLNGTDRAGSDIDLLVDIAPETSLFALARLERDLGELLGASVDVVPAGNLRVHLAEQVLREAAPL